MTTFPQLKRGDVARLNDGDGWTVCVLALENPREVAAGIWAMHAQEHNRPGAAPHAYIRLAERQVQILRHAGVGLRTADPDPDAAYKAAQDQTSSDETGEK